MACLPPDLAEDHPDSIGVAIPGGHLHLDESVDDRPGVGELVYTGPNVMLGYAEEPADLALAARDDRAAHRRPRPRARRPLRGRGTTQPLGQGLRPAHRPRRRRAGPARRRRPARPGGRHGPRRPRLRHERTRQRRRTRARRRPLRRTPARGAGHRRAAGAAHEQRQARLRRPRRARHAGRAGGRADEPTPRPTATPAPSAPTSSACSAAPTPPTPTRSSRSAATRCPTSSSRPGSPTTSRDGLPAGWHVRGIGELERLAATADVPPDADGTTGTSTGGRPPAAPHDVPRHDGRAAGARDRAHRRQPRGPRRPRGRRPPAPRARRLQLRALPALRARRRPHPAAARPRRPGPARRTGGAVGRRRRARARQLRPHHRPVRPRDRQRVGVGRPVAAVVPRVARVAHRRRAGRRPRCRCCTAWSGVRRSASRSACWPLALGGQARRGRLARRPDRALHHARRGRSSSPSGGRARGPRPVASGWS